MKGLEHPKNDLEVAIVAFAEFFQSELLNKKIGIWHYNPEMILSDLANNISSNNTVHVESVDEYRFCIALYCRSGSEYSISVVPYEMIACYIFKKSGYSRKVGDILFIMDDKAKMVGNILKWNIKNAEKYIESHFK